MKRWQRRAATERLVVVGGFCSAKTEQRGRKGKRQIELDSPVEDCIMRYSTGSAASLVRSRSEPPLDSGGHASRRIGISKTIVEACEEQI